MLPARGLGFTQKLGHQPSRLGPELGRQVGLVPPSGHNLGRMTAAAEHVKIGPVPGIPTSPAETSSPNRKQGYLGSRGLVFALPQIFFLFFLN